MSEENNYPILTLEITGDIALVTLQVPPVNALSCSVLEEMSLCFTRLPFESIRAIILTGSPEYGFSAGANIRELLNKSLAEKQKYFQHLYRLFRLIENTPFPLIAAINRFAMGAGLELALCADIRIIDEDARLTAAGVNMGLVFGTQRLSRLIGLGQAKTMLFTGHAVNANEAHGMGLVQDISPPGEALQRALELAKMIARKSPASIREVKEVLNKCGDLPLAEGLELENDRLNKVLGDGGFCQEAQAFLNRSKK